MVPIQHQLLMSKAILKLSGPELEGVLRSEIRVAEVTAKKAFEDLVAGKEDEDFTNPACLVMNIELNIWRREKLICKIR